MQTRKRILSMPSLLAVLTLVFLAGLLVAVTPKAAAADAHVSLSALKYTVNKDNTVTITDCSTGARGALDIPATIDGYPVTKIGSFAFNECSQITSVTIPNSVTTIGANAFWYCTSLRGVVIPDSVTSLGEMTFCNCTSLISASVGNGITTLNSSTFKECTSLQMVTLPDTLTKINSSAFYGCENLTAIVLPNSLKTIGTYTFYHCTALESIVIPDSVTSLGGSAFEGCTNLKSVSLSRNLKSIGSDAFIRCTALESIVIPDSVTSLGSSAFESCTALKTATVGGGITTLSHQFDRCTALETLIIHEGLKSLGDDHVLIPFMYCSNLKTVYLPSSLCEINRSTFMHTSLADVYFAGTAYAWGGMAIGTSNDPLLNATMHYIPFSDVIAGEYYYTPMAWAIDGGITNGTSDTTFSPNDNCTQAQIITFLYRAVGSPPVSGGSPYTNDAIEPSQYYYNALIWANRQGVVTDIGLDPNANCTRSEVVMYLWRLDGKPSASGTSFTDVSTSASYAPAVAWAVNQGVTTGTTDTTFSPNDICTRAQIVTFLHRALA